VLSVDDAELGPAEVLQQVQVNSAELRRLRVNIERENVTAAPASAAPGGARVEPGLDMWHLERVAHRVDVAGDGGTARPEDRRHAQTRLVADCHTA